MSKSNLDQDAAKRLEEALAIVGGNVALIEQAIKSVTFNVRERARRTYLRNEIGRLLRKSLPKPVTTTVPPRIIEIVPPPVTITPRMRAGARWHEQQLVKGIPEHDR